MDTYITGIADHFRFLQTERDCVAGLWKITFCNRFKNKKKIKNTDNDDIDYK